jgi:S-methylmethionine-dependent homocysteine/selenocysteine methylase
VSGTGARPAPTAGPAPGTILLDGPLGSELERRGCALPAPLWSAVAVRDAPGLVAAIHADYAAAGADVHTAATFRTTARALAAAGVADDWRALARRAVALCRDAAAGARVAGSIAPLEDCFSPGRTPPDAALQREHAALAGCLAEAGCDLLLVETMPTLRELRAATAASVATGLPVWSALTLGPAGDFFDVAGIAEARAAVLDAGAQAFLINCSAPPRITAALDALPPPAAPPAPALGAYGNCLFEGGTDWSPERYADEAARWAARGARILGGCCGTTPAHLFALRARLRDAAPRR